MMPSESKFLTAYTSVAAVAGLLIILIFGLVLTLSQYPDLIALAGKANLVRLCTDPGYRLNVDLAGLFATGSTEPVDLGQIGIPGYEFRPPAGATSFYAQGADDNPTGDGQACFVIATTDGQNSRIHKPNGVPFVPDTIIIEKAISVGFIEGLVEGNGTTIKESTKSYGGRTFKVAEVAVIERNPDGSPVARSVMPEWGPIQDYMYLYEDKEDPNLQLKIFCAEPSEQITASNDTGLLLQRVLSSLTKTMH